MGAEEEKGFVIRDRRGRPDAGGPPSQHDEASGASREPQAPPMDEPAQPPEAGPPVTFSSFVFSLGTSALMFMGEQLDPRQAKVPVNLAQAKEIIDILSMLQGKTQGNLDTEEQAVLEDMLYALRMKYVDLASSPAKPGARQADASS
jgi:hypothetical protein